MNSHHVWGRGGKDERKHPDRATLPRSPSRRRAVQLIASGIGFLLAGGAASRQAGETGGPPTPASDVLTRVVPSSGERLPVIGLGTYRTFDVGEGETERAPIREVLRRFVAHGGRVVDSSPMYGRAETVAGDLAADLGVGARLFHATKVWTHGREAGIRQMEASFQRMRVVRMDLMQVHNLADVETHLRTLAAWKAEGRVRYVGVTHYHEGAYDSLERLILAGGLDFVQLNYSIAERAAEARLLPLARDKGTAVLINRPFAQSNLFRRVAGQAVPEWCGEFDCASWAQFFLKYIVAHPAVTCVLPATSKPAHLDDNMGAGAGALPDQATRARMAALIDRR